MVKKPSEKKEAQYAVVGNQEKNLQDKGVKWRGKTDANPYESEPFGEQFGRKVGEKKITEVRPQKMLKGDGIM